MPRRNHRPLVLLLAFLLGGIGLPLAHQLDHYLDARAVTAPDVEDVVAQLPTKPVHECELCEVRLVAEGITIAQQELEPCGLQFDATVGTVVMLELSRAFDGRAPPAKA